jgi:hypothetical protein
MNPPFFMPGTTTTHSALLSTEPGMPLSGVAMISSKALAALANRSSVALSAMSRPLDSESKAAITTTVLMGFSLNATRAVKSMHDVRRDRMCR